MTDARWTEVEDDLASACRHFGNAARLYDQGGFDRDDLAGYMADMALQHAMQSAHTSLEGALLRILEFLVRRSRLARDGMRTSSSASRVLWASRDVLGLKF